MEKIVVETAMKKIPEKCTDCKFSLTGAEDISSPTIRFCSVCGWRELQKVFIEERKNWTYIRPDWCPLAIYEVEE